MRSRTAVPLITAAVTFPPPATAILFPNPLATRVAPPATVNRRWGHQERMFVAIGGDTFANDVQAIVYAFGDRQDFEIAGR
jgi:hypothetical protein